MNFSLEIGPKTDLETLPKLKDVYITFLPGGDFKKLKSSIQNKIYTLDESTTVITGHGPETSIKKEMTNNMVIRYNS